MHGNVNVKFYFSSTPVTNRSIISNFFTTVRLPGYGTVHSGTPFTNNHISCHSLSSPLYPQLITLEQLQEASLFYMKCRLTDSAIRHNSQRSALWIHQKFRCHKSHSIRTNLYLCWWRPLTFRSTVQNATFSLSSILHGNLKGKIKYSVCLIKLYIAKLLRKMAA
jgi:hypothetical protein